MSARLPLPVRAGVVVFADPKFGWRVHEDIDPSRVMPFTIAPGEVHVEQLQPDKMFRGDALFVATVRRGVWVTSLRVGNVETMMLPVPTVIFSRDEDEELQTKLCLPTCDIAHRIVLELRNDTPEPVAVRAWLRGRFLKET